MGMTAATKRAIYVYAIWLNIKFMDSPHLIILFDDETLP